MVFYYGFTRLRMLPLREQTVLLFRPVEYPARSAPSLAGVKTVLASLGFIALTVSSAEAQLYERGDVAAAAYQVPFESSFILTIASADRVAMIRVAEVARDAFPKVER